MKPTAILIGLSLTFGIAQSLLAQSRTPLATVSDASGTVQVMRPPDYRPSSASEGTSLYDGDLIKVQPGSTAVVQCKSSSSTRTIPNDGVARGIANFCS